MNPQAEYQTPRWLWDSLNEEFQFTYDLAATPDNALTDRYSVGPCKGPLWLCECGLCVVLRGERIFCNPPFDDMPPWVAQWDTLARHNVVVAIHRADPSVGWWRRVVEFGAKEVRFPPKRVNFDHSPRCGCKACLTGTKASNDSPIAISIWGPGRRRKAPVVRWLWES